MGAVLELDTVNGSGGIPVPPLGSADLLGDVARLGPRKSVVLAVLNVGSSRCPVVAGAPHREQRDPAGSSVHDRGRVSARLAVPVNDHVEGAPRMASVGRPGQNQVDVSGIGAA